VPVHSTRRRSPMRYHTHAWLMHDGYRTHVHVHMYASCTLYMRIPTLKAETGSMCVRCGTVCAYVSFLRLVYLRLVSRRYWSSWLGLRCDGSVYDLMARCHVTCVSLSCPTRERRRGSDLRWGRGWTRRRIHQWLRGSSSRGLPSAPRSWAKEVRRL